MKLKDTIRQEMTKSIIEKIPTLSDRKLINCFGTVCYNLTLTQEDYEDDKEIVRRGN